MLRLPSPAPPFPPPPRAPLPPAASMTALDPTVGLCELGFIPSQSPDEERRRRMISNRESARRSRLRRLRHLDDLRCMEEHLQAENRCVADRLRAMIYHSILLRLDNARLHSESAALRRRLVKASRAYLYTSCRWFSWPPPPPPQPPPPPSSAVAAGTDSTRASLMA